ncbi:hypothetical protein VNO80_30236 [Phaseolus coccineus]|uniref:Uncharacterized protein n=1 Tax=Phaseolus coccineus TaxID=3886 RepID=A0AAN9LCG9_PHACN
MRMGGRGREGLWLKEGPITTQNKTTQLTTTPSLHLHLYKNILIRLRMDLKSVIFSTFLSFLSFPSPVGFSAVVVML